MDKNETLLDLDSMLEGSLDGVEAAPEFIEPPDGKYILSCKSAKLSKKEKTNPETGEDETSNVINIVYSIEKTVEIKDTETPVPDKSLVSERFQANTLEQLGYFKTRAQKLLGAEVIKGVPLKDIIKGLPDAKPFNASIRTVETKDKGKTYRNTRITVKDEEAAE